ncbi:protein Bouncer [Cololabis saira]|uniref:protein Bouncer n=1 Tax=Cololabis saira TaxID=129043 RepID=UPI002AD4DAE3|nr:protein Bouncer [Cololabis saira]
MRPWWKKLAVLIEIVTVLTSPGSPLPLSLQSASFSTSKMNRIIFVLAAGFCFALAQGLKCYKCSIGLGDLCLTTETECKSEEHCFSGVGKAAKFVDIKMKGCLKVDDCNKTKDVTLPGSDNTTIYKMTKTCCDSDLCNAAPGLPGLSGLSLALAAISALFATNLLI